MCMRRLVRSMMYHLQPITWHDICCKRSVVSKMALITIYIPMQFSRWISKKTMSLRYRLPSLQTFLLFGLISILRIFGVFSSSLLLNLAKTNWTSFIAVTKNWSDKEISTPDKRKCVAPRDHERHTMNIEICASISI